MTPEELMAAGGPMRLFGDGTKLELGEAMQACRDVLKAQMIHQFETETDPFGSPWEPWYWSSDYPAEEHKTLQHTGTLMASLVGNGLGHVEEISGDELVYGTQIVYAGKHQEGGTFTTEVDLYGRHGGYLPAGTEIKLPARPIIGWPDATIVKCEQAIVEDILGRWYAL